MRGCGLLILVAACSGDAATTSDASELDAAGDAGPPCADLRPVAACTAGFLWQGRQDAFTAAGGTPTGTVAIGMVPGETGGPFLCYARRDGELVCDGTFAGATFDFDTAAGVSDVVQVLAGGFGDLCALDASGVAWCIGSYNSHGQLATGGTEPASVFARWGSASAPPDPIVALGTGTSDQICALTATGELWCAGLWMGGGSSPALMPVEIASDVAAFYVDTFGQIRYRTSGGIGMSYNPEGDSAGTVGFTACRVSNGRAEYVVTSDGIVDGSFLGPSPEGNSCVLGSNGLVACNLALSFGGQEVIALAANTYFESDAFAVRADGAVLQTAGAEVRGPGAARVPGCE